MFKLVTAAGIEHGLVHTLLNRIPKSKRFKNVEPAKKAELEKKLKDDSELVEVQYVNFKDQVRGHRVADYTAGSGEPIYMFKFLHGHTYKIPKGLVNKVNDPSKKRPQREGSLDENGIPRNKDGLPIAVDAFVRPF